jgi:hypothetical protein
MKEDVKKEIFPLSPLEICWWLTSSPVSFVEGFLVLPLWVAAYFSGDANPS